MCFERNIKQAKTIFEEKAKAADKFNIFSKNSLKNYLTNINLASFERL